MRETIERMTGTQNRSDHPSVHVDHMHTGISDRFTSMIFPFTLIGHLQVGDVVTVTDDDVEPYLCVVEKLLDDGGYAVYRRL